MTIKPVIDAPITEQHFTIPVAAKRLGVHESTLRRAVNRGEIGYVDVAGAESTTKAPRIPESELTRWKNARYVAPRAS